MMSKTEAEQIDKLLTQLVRECGMNVVNAVEWARATLARNTLDTTTTNPDKDGFFAWTVEIQVHRTWVEDGFDLTDERAHAMVANDLAYAYGHEMKAKVLTAPDADIVAQTQGYENAAHRAKTDPEHKGEVDGRAALK